MNSQWLTPPEIIEALGPFDVDPAATCQMAHDGKPWKTARKMYCPCTDGLSAKWSGRVWLNPPYERGLTERFVAKLAKHGDGVALVMARTDSVWFQEYVLGAAMAVLFLRLRPHFYTPSGKRMADRARTASVLVAYGRAARWKLMAAGFKGKLVEINQAG